MEKELLRCEGEAGRLVRKVSPLVIQARKRKLCLRELRQRWSKTQGLEYNLQELPGDLLMEGETGEGDLHIPRVEPPHCHGEEQL